MKGMINDMNIKLLEKVYDEAFVPVLIGSLSFIGYVLYNQGKSDCIHEIYKRNWCVVDNNGNGVKEI